MTNLYIPRPRTLIALNITLIGLFWLVMPHNITETHAVIIQSARGAISIMVATSYAYALIEAAKKNEGGNQWALTAGICLAFTADAFGACLGIAWRWYDKPLSWTYEALWAFGPYLTAIAGIHHIVAPGAIDGRIPKRNMLLAGIAIGLGSLVAGLIIGFRIRDFQLSF